MIITQFGNNVSAVDRYSSNVHERIARHNTYKETGPVQDEHASTRFRINSIFKHFTRGFQIFPYTCETLLFAQESRSTGCTIKHTNRQRSDPTVFGDKAS